MIQETGGVSGRYEHTPCLKHNQAACFLLLCFPRREKYVTESGFPLGIWVRIMRVVRTNQRANIATPERIERLDKIGMVWAVLSDQWDKMGNWISHQRMTKCGSGRGKLTAEQMKMLKDIGMQWPTSKKPINSYPKTEIQTSAGA